MRNIAIYFTFVFLAFDTFGMGFKYAHYNFDIQSKNDWDYLPTLQMVDGEETHEGLQVLGVITNDIDLEDKIHSDVPVKKFKDNNLQMIFRKILGSASKHINFDLKSLKLVQKELIAAMEEKEILDSYEVDGQKFYFISSFSAIYFTINFVGMDGVRLIVFGANQDENTLETFEYARDNPILEMDSFGDWYALKKIVPTKP